MSAGLADRAAQAFQQGGEEAYWDTLSTPPVEPVTTRHRRTGPGYEDETDEKDRSGLFAVDSQFKRIK